MKAAWLLLILAMWAGDGSDQEPAAPLAPRDYLALFDIDDKSLGQFADGTPLDVGQREKLLSVLLRLRQYPLAALDHYVRPAADVSKIAADPSAARGEVFTLSGRVTRLLREPLEPEAAERFGFEAYFRCTLKLDSGGEAEVCALAVPRGWKVDEPLDERAGAKALFLKTLPAAEGTSADAAARLLFAAPRVAGFADNALGKLGMDVGLLDEVRDRSGLNEREAFYQLLAAVRRADPAALAQEARRQISEQQPIWQRQAGDNSLDREQRMAARRALDRAEHGAHDVVPLFNEPQAQRGRLVTLRGDALRAVEVRVEDPDIVSRFGIRRYYEVELLTDDSQNNPLVCCLAELPQGMPLGDNIHAAVRVTGFFFKSWAYRAGSADGQASNRRFAPLIVARTLTWYPDPARSLPSSTLAIVLAVALALGLAALVYIRRGDHRALAAARQARLQLPERIEFDDSVSGEPRTTER
jgi:hypothetical protein